MARQKPKLRYQLFIYLKNLNYNSATMLHAFKALWHIIWRTTSKDELRVIRYERGQLLGAEGAEDHM